MVQEVGVEVDLHHLHQLGAQMCLLEHPLADQFAGSGCLVVLDFQTPEPPGNFSEVGFQCQFPEPPRNFSEPPKSTQLLNQWLLALRVVLKLVLGFHLPLVPQLV
jgi:hypothetical protein